MPLKSEGEKILSLVDALEELRRHKSDDYRLPLGRLSDINIPTS